jgi:hypothetical protein
MEEQTAWHKLFELISVADRNEEEISSILAALPDDQRCNIINKPSKHYSGDETMLMWAAWRHKVQTVQDLINYGADPFFTTDCGENVVTYLQIQDQTDQSAVFEIATILHKQGVRLDRDGMFSYSLVRRIKEYNLEELRVKIKQLGYYIPKPE